MVQVVAGFSKTNRWLLYTSAFLTPTQGVLGFGSRFPIGIGFLAYNWYNQIIWYEAIRHKQLHALSLLPSYFNLIYAFTYLGGIPHHNVYIAGLLGLGTVGLIILNEVAAWTSWATNQPQGFGVYQFFFFGWRTLTPGWHTFMLLWQIGDTFLHIVSITFAFAIVSYCAGDHEEEEELMKSYVRRLPAILIGSGVVLFFGWPLILWTELIINRNHIESDTDMISVYLFIVQVVLMFMPGGFTEFMFKLKDKFMHLFTRRHSEPTEGAGLPVAVITTPPKDVSSSTEKI